jgi:hypothetical protein
MGHVRAILTAEDIQWDLQPEKCPPADDDLLTAALIDAASYRALSQALLHALSDLQQHYTMTTGQQYHRVVDDLEWDRGGA